MLKRQRPATPPPSSLGDPPSFFPDGPIRSPHIADSHQPRSKRQRIRAPPLDGALRGWLESESANPHGESDGEEDRIEDVCDALPPTTTPDQYKDANILLHELHVLNQHRLLFVHPPRDRCLNATSRTHIQDLLPGERPPASTDAAPHHPAPSYPAHDRLASQSRCFESAEKGLVEEVQCVRQHYEDANRYDDSLCNIRTHTEPQFQAARFAIPLTQT